MNYPMLFIVPAIVVALLALPFLSIAKGKLTGKQVKRRVVTNLTAFGLVCLATILLPIGGMAFAAEPAGAAAAATTSRGTSAQGLGFLAAALVTGLSAIGAGIAVAAAAPAAIGAVSENPKSFGKSIIFVVLGEGIAIYGLLISILIINKL